MMAITTLYSQGAFITKRIDITIDITGNKKNTVSHNQPIEPTKSEVDSTSYTFMFSDVKKPKITAKIKKKITAQLLQASDS